MKILAHRGASAFAPENTLEAFRLGLELGADGLELDVHLTREGKIVVFHDPTLTRMTGKSGRISGFTLDELKALDFPIPTLEEVYAMANDFAKKQNRTLTINVELKTDEELYPTLPGKLLTLAPIVEFGTVIYSSFNHYSLTALRQLDPAVRIGILYNLPLVDPHLYAAHLKANALHPPWQIITALPQIVADCHALGIEVNVWTVNDETIAQKMHAAGADTLITDRLFPCGPAKSPL